MDPTRLTENVLFASWPWRDEELLFRRPFRRPTTRRLERPSHRTRGTESPAEAVPARRAHLVIGKLRYHVVVPQQDAVERPGGRHKLATALGENHALDQGIDRRIFDADVVARARRFGRLRAP